MFGWLPWRKQTRDREIEEELDYHLAMLAREGQENGRARDEAQYSARRKLGNQTLIQERLHDMWSWTTLESIWQDVRYGARTLRANPGFTLAAVLSLALGIGANTALFQLLNGLVLRALPVNDPEALARIDYVGNAGRTGNFWEDPDDFTNPQWEQIRAHHEPFSGVLAWTNMEFNLAPHGEARYAKSIVVSGEFFQVLGVNAYAGRLFTPSDDQRGCASPGAVIGYGFWQSEFGGARSALGRQIRLNGHSIDVIGITPPEFSGPDIGKRFEIAVPICAEPMLNGDNALDARATWWLGIMGRRKPGVSIEQASAYLSSVWPGIIQATINPGWRADAVKEYKTLKIHAEAGSTGFSRLRDEVEHPLILLFTIAALVLLIACANLANLLLARATAREGEIAVRLAIGASRWRVVRQLMSESFLLALLGTAVGTALAQFVSRYLLAAFATSNQAWFLNLVFDWRSFLFVALLVTLACVLFGLAPAVRATRHAPSASMKASGRNVSGSRERFGLQRLLVIAQLSLSLILLVGSLLFVRSFHNLMTLDPGFRQQGLLAVWLDFNDEAIPEKKRMPLYDRMLERVRSIPGIDSAALVANPPLSDSWANDNITLDKTDDKAATNVLSNFNRVSSGYFQTMSMPLIAGRDFNSHDTLASPPVAVVDKLFVARFLHGENPLGKNFHIEVGPGEKPQHFQIIGLVNNAKYGNLQRGLEPTVYLDEEQDPTPSSGQAFVVHSNLALAPTTSAIRSAMEEIDPHSTIQFKAMPAMIYDLVRREDVMAKLSSIFGVLAVVLATIGLYGVMSFIVAQRRNEIGIRMAVGASGREIIKLMLRQSAVLLLVGLIAGTALSLMAGRAAKSLLFELQPNDPATILSAILGLMLVTAFATLIPARRAARLDPMTALREE